MKTIFFKPEKILKYWSYLWFLRTNGILLFCQKLSREAYSALVLYNRVIFSKYYVKLLNEEIVIKLINKKFFKKIRNFNTVLLVGNIKDLITIEEILKKNNILILGFLIQSIFFFKKDFDIKKIEKKKILENITKRILMFFNKKKKIITFLKKPLIKLILILKKKL